MFLNMNRNLEEFSFDFTNLSRFKSWEKVLCGLHFYHFSQVATFCSPPRISNSYMSNVTHQIFTFFFKNQIGIFFSFFSYFYLQSNMPLCRFCTFFCTFFCRFFWKFKFSISFWKIWNFHPQFLPVDFPRKKLNFSCLFCPRSIVIVKFEFGSLTTANHS